MTRKKTGKRDPFVGFDPTGALTPRTTGYNAPTKQMLDRVAYIEKWRTFLVRLCLGRFKWSGLPDTVSERYLERVLLLDSRAIFFDLNGDLKATGVIPQGPPNLYGDWDSYKAQGANGQTFPIPDGQGVMVYDSHGRKPTWPIIELAVMELTEVDMNQGSNLRQQRNAIIVETTEENQGDAVKLLRALEMDETQMLVSKEFTKNVAAKAINTGIDYLQDKFHQDRTAKLNNIYLMLGIDHVPFEKQAHLLETEADKSTDSVATIRYDLLRARRDAAKEVNERWGTNITVEWNTEMDEVSPVAAEEEDDA